MAHEVRVLLGIGSNIGDRRANFDAAFMLLEKEPGIQIIQRAPLYTTAPLHNTDQDWFLNSVIEIKTSLSPLDLLHVLKKIEALLGRDFTGPRFGPRILDLDILLYGQEVAQLPELEIPHPRLSERRFVLAPICDILPNVIHPVMGKTMMALFEKLPEEGQEIKKICL